MSGTITHSWNGTVLTVTSDSGTSSADLKGAKGDTGIRGAQGAEGKIDTSRVYTRDNPPTYIEVGAAPSGFGYGEMMYYSGTDDETALEAEFDSILETMQSRSTKQIALNSATFNSHMGLCIIYKSNQDYAVVSHYCYYSNIGVSISYKIKSNGVWYPVEYDNPPMFEGVEYRTTERHNGEAVYTKLVTYYVGSDGIGGSGVFDIEIPHNISNFKYPVRCNATCSIYIMPELLVNGGASVFTIDATNIKLRIINDSWSGGTFNFPIYYTKN